MPWILIFALPLTCFFTLSKPQQLSVPQPTHLFKRIWRCDALWLTHILWDGWESALTRDKILGHFWIKTITMLLHKISINHSCTELLKIINIYIKDHIFHKHSNANWNRNPDHCGFSAGSAVNYRIPGFVRSRLQRLSNWTWVLGKWREGNIDRAEQKWAQSHPTAMIISPLRAFEGEVLREI